MGKTFVTLPKDEKSYPPLNCDGEDGKDGGVRHGELYEGDKQAHGLAHHPDVLQKKNKQSLQINNFFSPFSCTSLPWHWGSKQSGPAGQLCSGSGERGWLMIALTWM